MKATTLAWPLFWGAYDKQDPTVLNEWLARWGFGDDGATILISPQAANEDPLAIRFTPQEMLMVQEAVLHEAQRAESRITLNRNSFETERPLRLFRI